MAVPETESESKSETIKVKPRPIVRLGIFLISQSLVLSVICCIAAVLALLLLPVLAKNTYISENALMPGSASPMLSYQDVSDGNQLVKDILTLRLRRGNGGIEAQELVARYMSELGAEVSYHKFHPVQNQFHPLRFFSGPESLSKLENFSCAAFGVNVVGTIRAPRGDGKEAIVLVTPYNSTNDELIEALPLSIVYSVFSLLTRVTWLAKDIIWLVADSKHGDYSPVAAWLRDYHSPSFKSLGIQDAKMCENLKDGHAFGGKISDAFRRAGTMAAALVLKVGGRRERYEDTLSIHAEASNGQMPNLDLINIVNFLAVHRQGFHAKVEKFGCLLKSNWLRSIGQIFEFLGKVTGSINPDWKFSIPAEAYVEGSATLASSMYYQALGIPTGPHGAFRDYQVDAITLKVSPKASFDIVARQHEFVLRGGRLIEGVIRSVNNLLEKFHQSFFLYLLTSPSKFVSVGVYMIAFALLVAPLPMVAASLYSDINSPKGHSDGKSTLSAGISFIELDIALRSWKWLNATKKVLVVHFWGAIISLLPYFISQLSGFAPKMYFGMWFVISTISHLMLLSVMDLSSSHGHGSRLSKREWALLKSVTISAVFIGLCLMSVTNFATAEFGALLTVPMCLMASPLKLDIREKGLKSLSRMMCSVVLAFVNFPPIAFLMLKGASEGFGNIDVGDFWNWLESLWVWNSATYLYIGMIHIPCWVLCIHILLHPC